MNLLLKVWRQNNPQDKGRFVQYNVNNISPDMSFLEMLDVLNDSLEREQKEPVAFDHDCREGICGACGFMIDGRPHGGRPQTTTCQLHMRHFRDGQTIVMEPFRARAFPVVKDLVVDRGSFDRIQQSGGYISVNTGSAPEANAIPIPKQSAEAAFDAAACIGCGACVAACKNASAALFTGAKISQFSHLPQGKVEEKTRVLHMTHAMEKEGFGHCTNEEECEAACPKGISTENIVRLNGKFIRASFPSK